ncbi:MAG: beta-propeller fold lactonase family protein [Bryobacteraceae bacterium]
MVTGKSTPHIAFLGAALFFEACTGSDRPAAAPGPDRVALYAAVGTDLTHYTVDVENTVLAKKNSVPCPASIQYAWPHPTHKYLYVAWSDGGPSGAAGAPTGGARHGVSAFRIDAASGDLHPHGADLPLVSRPVHVTTDIGGDHLLVAHTIPSALTVYRIHGDGTLGPEVKQQAALDAGVYAHQVRVDPSNKQVILVTRGNGPTAEKKEDPGALKVFAYDNREGQLRNLASIAPGGGFGFQPRHLDFHPSQPWVFVSVERQNQLHMYRKTPDGGLEPAPLFNKSSLPEGFQANSGQAASTVHVHPNGRFVYQGNRASGTEVQDGKRVFAGGENAIAVYAIDGNSGEPTLIQNADTHGFSPRTFALDPSARLLVAANQVPMLVRRGAQLETIPASLALFRVDADGKLTFTRKYDMETTDARSLFWMGIVQLP